MNLEAKKKELEKMFNVIWIDLETGKKHKRVFDNYDDKLEFCATYLFPLILEDKIVRIN